MFFLAYIPSAVPPRNTTNPVPLEHHLCFDGCMPKLLELGFHVFSLTSVARPSVELLASDPQNKTSPVHWCGRLCRSACPLHFPAAVSNPAGLTLGTAIALLADNIFGQKIQQLR